ncbi:sulfatase family protein [Pontiella sulfatireligans]|uniref:Choline-sulfatase n=1 Tax=Pontiella sulfatireligans TaxID=2750658 RepID=A0A6C2UT83_9BACT|nr:sulfatase [Pontiella sulfatireligans]SPS74513.1 sulfatase S1_30 [Kiritimatiellales bacterium]VGO22454.1 Choline-sulfatase [Pontiella sulfatireligans]
MKRRNFTAIILATTVTASVAKREAKPNLLVIQTDEHNFRTLGCYRELMSDDQAYVWGKGVKVDTPNLDRVADEGAICTSYYSSCPVCTPSRASFVTGLYPIATGSPLNDMPLHDGLPTFGSVLQDQGYATAYVGKWHLDGEAKPGFEPPRKFGFSDNRYMMNRGHWKGLAHENGKPIVIEHNPKTQSQKFNVSKATPENYTTDFLTSRAIEIMERDKGKPFCVVLSIPDPHDPNPVRPPYNTMFEDLKFEEPRTMGESSETKPKWAYERQESGLKQKHMQDYFGMVKCIDDNVGRLLQFLEANGLDENTIVVFTADHGDLLYEHNRRNKGMPYEASAKIPFLIRWPGKIRPGKIINTPYNTSDFPPTILGVMGAPAIPGAHGVNDAKAFLSPDKVVNSKAMTYVSGPSASWAGLFGDRYKFVLSHKDVPWLFDLKKDPNELTNFATNPEYARIVQSMEKELDKRIKHFNDPVLKNKIIYTGDQS